MNSRCVQSLIPFAFAVGLIVVCSSSTSGFPQPSQVNNPPKTPQQSAPPTSNVANGLEVLKADEGTWDAAVSLWLRPDSEPIRSRAVVTARMAVGGMYLEQRFEGKFGPEMENKAWSTLSFTKFNATTGVYETVRMASSESPMIIVRGKAISGR